MKWILDDLNRAWQQLQRWQTWAALGLLAAFGAIAWLVSRFAFRTDAVLIFLHRTAGGCREMNNGAIIFMFCGMIFFAFTAVLTLGEFQRYVHFKHRAAHHQARQALVWGVVWGAIALLITAAALMLFGKYCR